MYLFLVCITCCIDIIQYTEPPLAFPRELDQTIITYQAPNNVTGASCRQAKVDSCIKQGYQKEMSNKEVFERYLKGTYNPETYKLLTGCMEQCPMQQYCTDFCYQQNTGVDYNPKECVRQMCYLNKTCIGSCFFNTCVSQCGNDENCISKCQEFVSGD